MRTNSDGTPLTDLASHNLYRTDSGRTLIDNISSTAAQPYLFSITVNSSTTLTFVITAVDTSGNESADSNTASYSYVDTIPPSPSKNLSVQKQQKIISIRKI